MNTKIINTNKIKCKMQMAFVFMCIRQLNKTKLTYVPASVYCGS